MTLCRYPECECDAAFPCGETRVRNAATVPVRITAGQPGEREHWYKITNIGQNAADLWIYDEIGRWGISAEGLVSEIASLNVSEITVHLNSPGGVVFEGIAIMNALRDHPASVTIKVDALAASIASVIAQAGNKVIMGRNSMMMIHNASGWAEGEAEDLEKMAALLRTMTGTIADVYAERAGGKAKDWLAVMKEETWYSAEEAVAAGLADEVAPLPTEREARQAAAKFDLSNYAHAPKIDPLMQPAVGETGPELVPRPLPEIVRPDLVDTMTELTEPIAWDPTAFKTALASAVPEPVTWDPSLFKAAVSMVTNDVPEPEPLPPPEPDPVSAIDPGVFASAIRKARA